MVCLLRARDSSAYHLQLARRLCLPSSRHDVRGVGNVVQACRRPIAHDGRPTRCRACNPLRESLVERAHHTPFLRSGEWSSRKRGDGRARAVGLGWNCCKGRLCWLFVCLGRSSHDRLRGCCWCGGTCPPTKRWSRCGCRCRCRCRRSKKRICRFNSGGIRGGFLVRRTEGFSTGCPKDARCRRKQPRSRAGCVRGGNWRTCMGCRGRNSGRGLRPIAARGRRWVPKERGWI